MENSKIRELLAPRCIIVEGQFRRRPIEEDRVKQLFQGATNAHLVPDPAGEEDDTDVKWIVLFQDKRSADEYIRIQSVVVDRTQCKVYPCTVYCEIPDHWLSKYDAGNDVPPPIPNRPPHPLQHVSGNEAPPVVPPRPTHHQIRHATLEPDTPVKFQQPQPGFQNPSLNFPEMYPNPSMPMQMPFPYNFGPQEGRQNVQFPFDPHSEEGMKYIQAMYQQFLQQAQGQPPPYDGDEHTLTKQLDSEPVDESDMKEDSSKTDEHEGGGTMAQSFIQEEEEKVPKQSNMIKVTNISVKATEDSVTFFFENRKKSGGGDVKYIDFDASTGSAIITFEDHEVVKRVLGKRPFLLMDQQISVEEFHIGANDQPSIVTEDDTGCTIEVQGVQTTTSKDTVEMYFENTRRSGGGPVEKIELVDGVYRLTFESPDVVEKIIGKFHKIDGAKLEVNKYVPPPPPKPVPMYDNRVFIKGLNPDTTQDGLENFLEAKTGITPSHIEYGELDGTAMVTFEERIDFQKLQQVCGMRKLDNSYLEVQKVPITNCIIVKNFGENTTSDTLEFYFDNKRRSGGGDVLDVKMDSLNGTCLVYFEDVEVLEDIIKRKHTIDGHELQVKIYYECIGQPVSDDSGAFTLPEAFQAEVEFKKLQFLMKSKPNQEALTKQLESSFAKPAWQECSAKSEVLKIECTLTAETKDFRKVAKTWKKDVLEELSKYLNMLSVEVHTALQDAWKLVLEQLGKISINNPDAVAVIIEKAECKIFIVGHKHMVTELSKQIKDIMQQVQQELDQKKQQVQEKASLKHFQILILQFSHFDEDICKAYKSLKMTYDIQKHLVIFDGLSGQITEVKVKMFEFLQNVAKSEVDKFSAERQSFLQSNAVRKYVGDKMKANHIVGVWDVQGKELYVYSLSDKDVVRAAHVLKEAVVESHVQLEDESVSLLTQTLWTSKVAEIISVDEEGLIRILYKAGQKDIILLGTDKNSATLRELVNDFFVFNTIFQESLQLSPGIMRFLQEQNQEEIRSINKNLSNDQVKVSISNTGIDIQGTKTGLSKAKKAIDDIVKKVEIKKHSVEKAGIAKYIQSQTGQDQISKLEKTEGVVVELSDEQSDDSSDGSSTTSTSSKRISEFATYIDQNGHKIKAVLGDMTELDVDVIVNAANKDLKHIGGLAKILVDKGGWGIQDECSAFIKKKGRLMEGDVFCSGAGSLRFKAIIHAVAPVWQNASNNEAEYLREAVLKSLETTAENHHTSIAIPALGTGVFGYPIREAAKVIVEAIKDHFDHEVPDSSIDTIYLIDVKDKTVDFFVSAMQKIFGTQHVRVKSGGGTVGTWKQKRRPSGGRMRSPSPPSPSSVSAGGISIQIIKGLISRQKVDVIVNTTSNDLNLSNGAVSNSLLQGGGPTLQQECSQNYPMGIQHGDVAITTGGNLNCQFVFHGALPSWKHGGVSAQTMISFMEKCLQSADRKRLSSVAFPAMGTGNLGYPRDVVAREMFNCVTQFATKNPRSSITDVRFVLYDKDIHTVKAFEMEEKRQSGTSARQGRHFGGRGTGRDSPSDFGATAGNFTDKQQFTLQLGKVTLKFYQGDITIADVDAIVNSTNTEFDLQKGIISRSLAKRFGAFLENQVAASRHTMRKEGIVVTAVNDSRAQYKYIIHLDSQSGVTRPNWQSKIEKTLKKADFLKVKSVGLPSLGKAYGVTEESLAEYVFNAILKIQNKLSHVTEVHVLLFDAEMIAPFLKSIKTCCDNSRGIFATVTRKVTNFFGNKDEKSVSWDNLRTANIPITSSSVILVFYGKTKTSIERAIDKFETGLGEVFLTKVVEDTFIKDLSMEQEVKIKDLQQQHGVHVTVEKRIGRIKIFGCKEDLHIVSDAVHKEIRKAMEQRHLEEEAKYIAEMVEWCFLDVTSTGQKLEKYPKEINLLLEKEMKNKKQKATFKDNHGKKYIVDFNSYEEYPEDDQTDRVKVIRKSKIQGGQMELPPNWSSMDKENVTVIQLQPSDPEYQNVVQQMTQTTGAFTIQKVERIQNKMLYQQFMAKKTQMETENKPSSNPVEMSLWHGTNCDAVPSINTHGFNRSYCGKNATVYGNGVYFAVNANYSASDTYSPRDPSMNKRMYFARVLTGDFVKGYNGLMVPPAKSTAAAAIGKHIIYDSVVDNVNRPGMFVIFNDTQAYPEYLVTFQ